MTHTAHGHEASTADVVDDGPATPLWLTALGGVLLALSVGAGAIVLNQPTEVPVEVEMSEPKSEQGASSTKAASPVAGEAVQAVRPASGEPEMSGAPAPAPPEASRTRKG